MKKLAILSFVTVLLTLVGCNKKDYQLPKIEASVTEVNFAIGGGQENITISSTRDWSVEKSSDWFTVTPSKGKAGKDIQLKVSVLANEGVAREANLTINAIEKKVIVIKQAGNSANPTTPVSNEKVVYKNNFDKSDVQKVDVHGKKLPPYLDQTEVWKNQEGSGVSSVTYAFTKGISLDNFDKAQSNSKSGSLYSGSGKNYLSFYSKNGAPFGFEIKDITLPASRNYNLSIGVKAFNKTSEATISKEQFEVYVSNDGAKWVKLDYTLTPDAQPNKWTLANSSFTLAEGVNKLFVALKVTVASLYSVDDIVLTESETAGTNIDFSTGAELDVISKIEAPQPSTGSGSSQPGSGSSQPGSGSSQPGSGSSQPAAGVATTGEYASDAVASTGTNSWPFYVKINGSQDVNQGFKLGTSKKTGSATVTVPQGVRQITFYALAWKGTECELKVSVGENPAHVVTPTANNAVSGRDGQKQDSPMTISDISDSNKYTINISDLVSGTEVTSQDTVVKFETSEGKLRCIVFGLKFIK